MWNDLSMKDKSLFMKRAVKNGIIDLNRIKDIYNSIISDNIYSDGGQLRKKSYKIDFSNIKTTRNRPIYPDYISYIYEKLDTVPLNRKAVILGNIIEESGGDPFCRSKRNTYQGLLQWADDRYRIPNNATNPYRLIDEQIDYIMKSTPDTSNNTNWTHGGQGSGYGSYTEPYTIYWNNNSSIEDMHKAFSLGYVRPAGKLLSVKNRMKVVNQVKDILNNVNKFGEGGPFSEENSKRDEQIKNINTWATVHPDRIFGDDFTEQRKYLTEDTWNNIYPKLNIKIGDSNWKKIPSYIQNRMFTESVSGAVDKAGKVVLPALAATAAAPYAIGTATNITDFLPKAMSVIDKTMPHYYVDEIAKYAGRKGVHNFMTDAVGGMSLKGLPFRTGAGYITELAENGAFGALGLSGLTKSFSSDRENYLKSKEFPQDIMDTAFLGLLGINAVNSFTQNRKLLKLMKENSAEVIKNSVKKPKQFIRRQKRINDRVNRFTGIPTGKTKKGEIAYGSEFDDVVHRPSSKSYKGKGNFSGYDIEVAPGKVIVYDKDTPTKMIKFQDETVLLGEETSHLSAPNKSSNRIVLPDGRIIYDQSRPVGGEKTKFTFTHTSAGSLEKSHHGRKPTIHSLYIDETGNIIIGKERSASSLRIGAMSEADQKAFNSFLDDLNGIIGDDGVLAGSSVPIGKGIYTNNLPNDIEIVTTKDKAPALIKKLGFKTNRRLVKVSGIQGTSKYAFEGPNGNSIDIDIIETDSNGFTRGILAHEAYMATEPEKYRKLVESNALKYKNRSTTEIPIPLTAEEVLQKLKEPEVMTIKTVMDNLGSQQLKHFNRIINSTYSDDALKTINEAIKLKGESYLKGFKNVSEMFPDIDFSNVEANKKFLEYLNIPDEGLSSNPERMATLANIWNYKNTVSTRGIQNVKSKGDIFEFGTIPFSYYGANAAGAGGNAVLGSSEGGGRSFSNEGVLTISQHNLTYHPENVKSLENIIELDKRRRGFRPMTVDEFNNINRVLKKYNLNIDIDKNGKLMTELNRIQDRIAGDINLRKTITHELSEALDLPTITGDIFYENRPYSGLLSDPVAFGFRPISQDYGLLSGGPEFGMNFPVQDVSLSNSTINKFSNTEDKTKVLEYVKNQFPDQFDYFEEVLNPKLHTKRRPYAATASLPADETESAFTSLSTDYEVLKGYSSSELDALQKQNAIDRQRQEYLMKEVEKIKKMKERGKKIFNVSLASGIGASTIAGTTAALAPMVKEKVKKIREKNEKLKKEYMEAVEKERLQFKDGYPKDLSNLSLLEKDILEHPDIYKKVLKDFKVLKYFDEKDDEIDKRIRIRQISDFILRGQDENLKNRLKSFGIK